MEESKRPFTRKNDFRVGGGGRREGRRKGKGSRRESKKRRREGLKGT